MSQNLVSTGFVAARIGPRRRKTDKEGKYNEFRSFRTVREYLSWWEQDEGKNWKVNSRQSHPRGSVEYWRCKFQIDGCYVCPARLRILIGFDDSVVLYRASGFAHQHDKIIHKPKSEDIGHGIPLEPLKEHIGRSFYVNAPPIQPEDEQDHEVMILLLNAREVLIPIREITNTVDASLLNTPQMLGRQEREDRRRVDDDEENEENEGNEERNVPPSDESVSTMANQTVVQNTSQQVQEARQSNTLETVQTPPKSTIEGVNKEVKDEVKEVQKPMEIAIQKEKEIETKEALPVTEVHSSNVQTTSKEIPVKTRTKLKPPKFATEGGVMGGFSVPRPSSSLPSPIKPNDIVDDTPRTQSDEKADKPNGKSKVEKPSDVKKVPRVVPPKPPKFATDGGVMGGSNIVRATTPPTTEDSNNNATSSSSVASTTNSLVSDAGSNNSNKPM
ncbi:hypothetical protein Mgra_00008869 [Meloidogyne graminicola]|uniref:Uncharacterized protein n=1 Tax=Meloidogyne graminicola TaxID=189291 RepID=A0A8S9ZEK1_9BILA|nr:hypothetical protein Mgra_00008869 [Meloidogyne graminicola]